MNITLKQNEIEFALRQYLLQRGLGEAIKTMPIKFGTTRNPFGITAELELPIEGTLPDAAPVQQMPYDFQDSQDQVTGENTVGSLLAHAGNVIETTQAMDTTEAKVEEVPAVDAAEAKQDEPVVLEQTTSAPEEVVQQQPVVEAAPEPVAQVTEAVVEEAKPVEAAPAATPAAPVENLFASPAPAAAPAAQPAQAAPIQTTSLFGN